MGYTYLSADAASGALIADLPLQQVQWGRQLNGAGTLTARLKLPPPSTVSNRQLTELYKDATDRLRRFIYVLRDGAPLGAWIVSRRRYDFVTQQIEIQAMETWWYWRRRFYSKYDLATLNVLLAQPLIMVGHPIQVARDILDYFTNDVGLDIPLDLSFVTDLGGSTVANVSHAGVAGKTVGEVIEELAAGDGDDGFDFRIDLVDLGGTLTPAMMMAKDLGQTVNLTAKLTTPEGRGNLAAGGVVEDERRANYILNLGQGDGAAKATGVAVDLNDDQTDLRWRPVVSTILQTHDEPSAPRLLAQAKTHMRVVSFLTVHEATVIADGVDAQIGGFVPGDVGNLVIEAGADPWYPDGYDAEQRIVAYQVTVPDTGGEGEVGAEQIALTFDDPVGVTA